MLVPFAIIWASCSDDYSEYLTDYKCGNRLMIDYHHSITNPQPLLRILDELYDQSITIITINPDVNITCQLKIYGCLDKCYLNYLNCRYPDTIIELPSSLGRFGSELVNLKSKQPEQTHRFTLGDSNLYVISGHQSLLSLFYSLPAVDKVSDKVSYINEWWLCEYPHGKAVMGSQQLFRALIKNPNADIITEMRDYEYDDLLPSITVTDQIQPYDDTDWQSLLPMYYHYDTSDDRVGYVETRTINDYDVKCHYYRDLNEIIFVVIDHQ